MYTRARGVEVGKWPAKRARRPRSRAISIRGRPDARGRSSPRTRLAAGGWRRVTKTLLCLTTRRREPNSVSPTSNGDVIKTGYGHLHALFMFQVSIGHSIVTMVGRNAKSIQ